MRCITQGSPRHSGELFGRTVCLAGKADCAWTPRTIGWANASGAAAVLLPKGSRSASIEGDFTPSSDGTLPRFTSRNGGYGCGNDGSVSRGTRRRLPRSRVAAQRLRHCRHSATRSRRRSRPAGSATLDAYELTSVRQPLALEVTGKPWASFWFHEYPVPGDDRAF